KRVSNLREHTVRTDGEIAAMACPICPDQGAIRVSADDRRVCANLHAESLGILHERAVQVPSSDCDETLISQPLFLQGLSAVVAKQGFFHPFGILDDRVVRSDLFERLQSVLPEIDSGTDLAEL